jgi:hypothetical protein
MVRGVTRLLRYDAVTAQNVSDSVIYILRFLLVAGALQ